MADQNNRNFLFGVIFFFTVLIVCVLAYTDWVATIDSEDIFVVGVISLAVLIGIIVYNKSIVDYFTKRKKGINRLFTWRRVNRRVDRTVKMYSRHNFLL
jgi:hypothetical protein